MRVNHIYMYNVYSPLQGSSLWGHIIKHLGHFQCFSGGNFRGATESAQPKTMAENA